MMLRILRTVPCRLGAWIAACLLLGTASTAIVPGTVHAIGGPRPVTVTVEGEVRRPGSYSLPHNATLSTLIGAAGGYTDNADLAAATLTREYAKPVATPLSHPRLLKGSPADLPLADGDTLRIPARTPGAPVRTAHAPTSERRSPARTTSA
jgi:protein involved in polysaccharide export with SLBB domain